jgi:hypothetical protein
VSSVDFGDSVLTVRRQLDRNLRLAPPKSRAGCRTLSMPSGLAQMLQAHLEARVGGRFDKNAFFFTAPRGGPPPLSDVADPVLAARCDEGKDAGCELS